MNYYQHHIGDFNNATRHLTRLERSVYRDLIELYYESECELPADKAAICRLILARSNEEATVVEQVLNEFFTETPNGYFHSRCDAEILKYKANNSQKAQAGKASAEARAARLAEKLNGRSTGVEQTLNGTPTNQEPLTNNQEPNKGEPKKRAAPIALPDCIPVDVWEMWDRYRNSKKGWTADAKKLNLRTLTDIANKGHDPRKVVETSIERGWTGLFEPKAEQVQKSSADYRRPAL